MGPISSDQLFERTPAVDIYLRPHDGLPRSSLWQSISRARTVYTDTIAEFLPPAARLTSAAEVIRRGARAKGLSPYTVPALEVGVRGARIQLRGTPEALSECLGCEVNLIEASEPTLSPHLRLSGDPQVPGIAPEWIETVVPSEYSELIKTDQPRTACMLLDHELSPPFTDCARCGEKVAGRSPLEQLTGAAAGELPDRDTMITAAAAGVAAGFLLGALRALAKSQQKRPRPPQP